MAAITCHLSQNQKLCRGEHHQNPKRSCKLQFSTRTSIVGRCFFFICLIFSSVESIANSRWCFWHTADSDCGTLLKVAAAAPSAQDNTNDLEIPSSVVGVCTTEFSKQKSMKTRGGSVSPLGEAERIIEEYLCSKGTSDGKFLIQGWRWHNLSLVRDTRRLEQLTNHLLRSSSSKDDIGQKIDKASYHVIDFNMKDLDTIERNIFFPWLREKITQYASDDEVSDAFATVLDEIEKDRELLSKLGKTVRDQCKMAVSTENPVEAKESVTNIAQMSAALTTRARSIFDRIERLVVPAVALLVSEKEQKYIDNKILLKLGLFQSRVHLVGMYEAVWELEGDGRKERELFRKMIPYIPQKMIPRWRRSLYEPQAGVLNI
uniref:Uncharacterized protein n=1 Tax=Ditylum brightwellii TaxID=49249 RepID=A0A6V2CEW3_9STRA|mmetsp:Transcript_25949/g.34552  ORF Transcript_25949/g.34552 Transcript_25949/m.34552 type:complete len:375 (+) Transcript_25949:30-1154(+)